MSSTIGGSVVWNLDVDDKGLSSGLASARANVEKTASDIGNAFSNVAKNISGQFDKIATSLDSTGNNLAKFGAVPTAGLVLSLKAAVDFEDQMSNVTKTVGLAKNEVKEVGDEFLNLSRSTRTSIPNLVDIATIGGQIGITKKDIVAFTNATNMATVALGDEFGSAEATAKAIGTLTTQYGLVKKIGVDESIRRTGSALNELGASGLATADYVTNFANRLGGASNLLKISAQDTLGLSAAVQETGLNVEASSSAIQRTLLTMAQAGAGFGDSLGYTGKEAEQFAHLMKTDVNKAFLMFLNTLSKLDPQAAIQQLDKLGLSSTLTSQTLLTIANKTDLITDKQNIANKAFAEGTSLLNEYNVKNQTTQAELDKFKNNIQGLGITIGGSLLPSINNLLTSIVPIVQQFATFAAENPGLVTTILSLGASFTGLGLALKALAVVFSGFSSLFAILGQVPILVNAIGSAIFALGPAFAFLAANPIILIIGLIIGAITLLVIAWRNNWGNIQGITKTTFEFIQAVVTSVVNNVIAVLTTMGSIIKGIWNGITSVTSAIWNGLSSIISGAINSLSSIVRTVFGSIASFIQTTWNNLINFFSGIGGKIVNAISQPFTDAWNEISKIASRIKEAANQINPFYRNSPSLVDNVTSGLAIIKDQFSSLSSLSFPSMAESAAMQFNDPIDRTLNSSGTTDSPTAVGNNQNITVNIDKVNDMQDVDMISREIGFKMAVV